MDYMDRISEYFEPTDRYTCNVVRVKEILELFGAPYKSKKDILDLLNNYGYSHNAYENLKLKKKKDVLKHALANISVTDIQRKYLLKN